MREPLHINLCYAMMGFRRRIRQRFGDPTIFGLQRWHPLVVYEWNPEDSHDQ